VRTTLTEDVYLTVSSLPDGAGGDVVLRVIIQPMAAWLWIGAGIMAGGTILAAWPGRRRRRPTDPVSAPVPDGHVDQPEAVPV
jgi:cytochrome c-type biogenesis protein CcmF